MACVRSPLFVSLVISLLSATSAGAQERIYLVQINPTQVHSFTFDGSDFTRNDLNPASPRAALEGGFEGVGLAMTDRLFVVGNGVQNVGASVLDPSTRAELPRVRTSTNSCELVISPDQRFAYCAAGSPSGVPILSVIDLRASSPTFLNEIAAVSIGASGAGVPSGATLGPDGHTLYVVLAGGSLAPNARIAVFDLDAPDQPALRLPTTLVPAPPSPAFPPLPPPSRPATLRAFVVGGRPFLFFARRDLHILEIHADGNVGSPHYIGSVNTVVGARRFMSDVFAEDTPSGPRAFVTSDAINAGGSGAEELLVLDLSLPLADDPTGTRVVFADTVSAGVGPFDAGEIGAAAAGPYLYVTGRAVGGIRPRGAELRAFHRAALLAGTPAVLTRIEIDPGTEVVGVNGLLVRSEVTSTSAPMVIDRVCAGGTGPTGCSPVLTNGQPQSLTISGSGLGSVRHVFLGLDVLTVSSVAATQVTVMSPVGVVAGNPPLVVVDDSGSIVRFDGLTVVNPPTFLPAHVAYAGGFAENRIALLNSATKTEVTAFFDSGQGPGRAVVSRDGRFLFVSEFRSGRVSTHSIVADPSRGYDWNERIGDLFVGGNPQALVLNSAGTRLYVNTVDGFIAVIDTSVTPPVLIDVDANAATTDPGLAAGLTRIATRQGPTDFTGVRGLAISPDGQWLYAGRDAAPHITAVFVGDDVVDPEDIVHITIPGAPSVGRLDLAMRSDGTRLYMVSAAETVVRVLSVAGAAVAPGTVLPLLGASPSTRHFGILPDSRFLYVSSRDGSAVHVFDGSTHELVALVPVGTGSDFPALSPDSEFVYLPIGDRDLVVTLDARPVSPALHQVVANSGGPRGTSGLAVTPGLETPAGNNVTIEPSPGVTITFATTPGGHTTVTSSNVSGLALPEGFVVPGLGVFFEINSSAAAGPVTVCVPYDDGDLAPEDEASLRLLHEEGGVFVDRTSSLDTARNTICGLVTSFSQFVAAVRRAERTICSDLQDDEDDDDRVVYAFQGLAAETVTITVAEDPSGQATGERIRLTLAGPDSRKKFKVKRDGSLPLAITGVLPKSGRYLVTVESHGGDGFTGDFCAALKSSGDAFLTFKAVDRRTRR